MSVDRTVSVIGLGYVGLPVAVSFAGAGFTVIGFDSDSSRVSGLSRGEDRTNSVDAAALACPGLRFTGEARDIAAADIHIVTVPTPIDAANVPDLSALERASATVGEVLRRGAVVVYESTVYPGATEEVCVPILEARSGLKLGTDFAVAYSPERINPGDEAHPFEAITKVVAASDGAALDRVAALYGAVVRAGVHKAPSIKVAEAAKVIENTQRDLNIALVNELAVIFERLGVDTHDVLEAAGTKWNFLKFTPGLVGGHCIGVDPYYLTHKAQMTGYQAQIVLAGRKLNEDMPGFVARQLIRGCATNAIAVPPRVTVLGVTFKPDIADIRNSKVANLVAELEQFGCSVQIHDPMCDPDELTRVYGLEHTPEDRLHAAEAVVLAVPHKAFGADPWPLVERCLAPSGPVFVADIHARLDRAARPGRCVLWRL
ncbi:nucleotide sugar dehydrogenase [Kaustia mangrovi]|uniref:Nucleotide sugar dehydrogenase n=1 Tax=Kaustia mangrovi TaxID=2593653 RepID=A0A7S8C8S1_9HYPH|nr:nucleotide sugar dehydrogenase [Kaustia mangrovi]QPC45457.1 nucleotide sugar dehydrogenase [Kaustia mangrovi]